MTPARLAPCLPPFFSRAESSCAIICRCAARSHSSNTPAFGQGSFNGMMTAPKNPMHSKVSPFTWVGLFISLFGFIAVRFAFRSLGVSNSITAEVWRELALWAMAALLILLIRRGEGLPLSSIHLGTAPWLQSLRHGATLTGLCGVTAYIVIL